MFCFYFKTAVDDVFSIDAEQFARVQSFRNEIKANVLYGSFLGGDDLLKALTKHLNILIERQWNGNNWKVLTPIEITPSNVEELKAVPSHSDSGIELDPSEEESAGFLELVAITIDFNRLVAKVMQEMTADANDLQRSLTDTSLRVAEARSSGSTVALIEAYDLVAGSMLNYDKRLRYTIPQLATALNGALDSYLRLRRLVTTELAALNEDISNATTSFRDLPATIRQTREMIETIKGVVEQMLPFTGRLRFARKQLLEVLDSYIASVTIFISRAEGTLGV